VYQDDKGNWALVDGKAKNYVAVAEVNPNNNETGWATLSITTNSQASDDDQAFAAGYIEGALTNELIYSSWMTTLEYFYKGSFDENVAAWVQKNNVWVKTQIAACANLERSTDIYEVNNCDYWYQVNLVLTQLDGMQSGYSYHAPSDRALASDVFLYLNIGSDISDIMVKVDPSSAPKTPQEFLAKDHCSVLIRYSAETQELYHSHTTWGHYVNMLRIFKHYTFLFNHPSTVSKTVSFSSFPGCFASNDDYFITDRGLIVTETTNEVYNMTLYDYVVPQTVLYWLRVIVSNRMSDNGSFWVNVFGKFNSGTYNNQWQVTDTKLFTPGKPFVPGTLYILEQIPGYVESMDATSFLTKDGFFPSYNIPYFPFIYNISGYPAQYALHGDAYSYSACPRANIFRRDAGKVVTYQDMQNIMRYNEYQTDPLSLGDPCNGISARCDLNTTSAFPFGGFDCKVSSSVLIRNMTTTALSGPTTLTQKPFSWTGPFSNVPHYGQPTEFNFDFEVMAPAQL